MNIQNPFEEIIDRLLRIENYLAAWKHDSQLISPPREELPVNISEASEVTGLAVKTIYGLSHQRIIPCHKRGKRLYFFRSELIAWIKSGRRQTIREIKETASKSLYSSDAERREK